MHTSALRDLPADSPLSRTCADGIHRSVDHAEEPAARPSGGGGGLRSLRGTRARLWRWLQRRRDRRVGSRLHQALSRLSDAELARRGLSRATPVHHLLDLDAATLPGAGEDRP
jgi:hypothetical protein